MPNHMLDRVFQSLSNPTRRQVIERLGRGSASMTELAEPFDMALPSLLQHLKVLENAHLVQSEKVGRVRTYSLNTDALLGAESWLEGRLNLWTTRLDQLDELLKTFKDNP